MIECLILGDSIAVGVSQIRKECVAYAKSGIDSNNWNKTYLSKIEPAKTIIISLGSNDIPYTPTEENVRILRKQAKAGKIYWLLPNEKLKPLAVASVRKVASEFGDYILERPKTNISPDGIHPTYKGYKEIADKTRN